MNVIKRLLIFFIAIIALLIIGCIEKKEYKSESTLISDKKGTSAEENHNILILPREKQKEANIEVEKASFQYLPVPFSSTAVIEVNPDKISKISSKISGKVVKILVSQGEKVYIGQVLAYYDSPEIWQYHSEYIRSKSKVELARKNLKREESLYEKKISPEKDLIKARAELEEAEAELKSIVEKTRILNIDLSTFNENRRTENLIPIVSPISGVIIEKNITLGETVNPEKILFTIADLSALRVAIDIPEKDISKIKLGMPAKISVVSYPETFFNGKVSLISDMIDEHTRTAKAVVILNNSRGLLKPGMFCMITIDSLNIKEDKKNIVVPEDAVVIDGDERYVFVKIDDEKFEKRNIKAGIISGKMIEIIDGLKDGEIVVTKGTFILKSELKKEELSEGHHD